jgi:hypothetical protein
VAKTALGCRSSPRFRVFVFVVSPIEHPAKIVWILQRYAPIPEKANFLIFFDFKEQSHKVAHYLPTFRPIALPLRHHP